MGILAADDNVWLMIGLSLLGALALLWFFRSVRAKERAGEEPLLSTGLFRDRTSNLGLVTQNVQWLLLMGSSFTIAAHLQVVRGYDAVQTGVILTAATLGLLVSSLAAERLARRWSQRTLIMTGFVVTVAGTAIAGTILVSGLTTGAYAAAMITLAVIGIAGLAAAVLLPRKPSTGRAPGSAPGPATRPTS
ncbi:hypothetical protein OG311_32065 [Streptomyces sp. NBC_01343]|uniref:MFS transporter n=1 Tax=Streptomyces sp. NBC_01343 TaxID=2903832 RepID=UPI002E15C4EB|nr:hypothetical protein OG311_32065 [Streptomyces sp. NBC_01343]